MAIDSNKSNEDPLAEALWEYFNTDQEAEMEVSSDISLPEQMPASYFFRGLKQMNAMEKMAMDHSSGRVLDIGAGAGCHSLHLQSKGLEVHSLEPSARLCSLLRERGIKHVHEDTWQDWKSELRYDTILMLMNGTGMASYLKELPHLLRKVSSLLTPNGRILLDSSDISYLYFLEDGSMMMDLGGSKQGEIIYTIRYKDEEMSFPWLFVKQEELKAACKSVGLQLDVIQELEESYLAELTFLSPRIPSSSL